MKFAAFAVLAVAAPAMGFQPMFGQSARTVALKQHIGSGGMADTRDPATMVNEDPRKSISAAPSFEEYMAQKNAAAGAPAPAAAAPVAAAPAAPAAAAPAATGGWTSSFGGAAPAAPAAPAAAAPVAAAPAAAAPAAPMAAGNVVGGFQYGAYDDQLWDNEAKKAVYAAWDPNSPRSGMNFNPFETFSGNSPDASGVFPGEPRYKDPKRGDVSYAIMQVEQAEASERAAAPKAGDVPGAPGNKN